ncbi:hypothetical protein BJ170DRAFT_598319 [Xylariales sp. AK1849]|nr:hypothetical protein BJ170DRAFT_598319 [Xylariales sp. AK1849]
MCHGHPHYHKCQHTSVKWLYCPEAIFDLDTGYETPCSNPIYSTPQPSNSDCPLQNCHFKSLRGTWTCCDCGHTNSQGWCEGNMSLEKSRGYNIPDPWTPIGLEPVGWQICGHGCCHSCSRNVSSRGSTPEMSFSDIRKGKGSRKLGPTRASHKRGYGYEYIPFPMVHEEGTGSSSPSSSGSPITNHDSGFDVGLDFSSKKSKPSSGNKKKAQRRSHHH